VCEVTEEPYGFLDLDGALYFWLERVFPELRRRRPEAFPTIIADVAASRFPRPELEAACAVIAEQREFPERTAALVLKLYSMDDQKFGFSVRFTVAVVVLFEALYRHLRHDETGQLNLFVPCVPEEGFFEKRNSPWALGKWIRDHCPDRTSALADLDQPSSPDDGKVLREFYRVHIDRMIHYLRLLTPAELATAEEMASLDCSSGGGGASDGVGGDGEATTLGGGPIGGRVRPSGWAAIGSCA